MSETQEPKESISTPLEESSIKEEDDEAPSGYLCQLCGLEEPMYPHNWDSGDPCGIYCADCFWEEDSKRKKARRAWLHSNPEALEAYRKHVCEVLNLSPSTESPSQQ